MSIICLHLSLRSWGDPFTNFTFDEPNLDRLIAIPPSSPFLFGTEADVAPGWTITYDGQPQNPGIPGQEISLILTTSLSHPFFGPASLSVSGCCRQDDPLPRQTPFAVSFSQTGSIPIDADELNFYDGDLNLPLLRLRIDGQVIPHRTVPSPIFEPESNPLKAANVREFAGQQVLLEFEFPKNYSGRFDIFGFTIVPEPEPWALLLAGGAVLGWRCRPRRRPAR